MISMQAISCNNHYSAIFNRQSLVHPSRVAQSIYKSKKIVPQVNTSLRSLNSNSSHFSKNIKNINNVNKHKEQPFSKNLITSILKNGTFCTVNPKKRFRDDENSNKSFTTRDPNSAKNNSCLANPKKRSKTHDSVQKSNAENFRIVKNSSEGFAKNNSNSKENNSHSANPKKRCIEATTRNSVQGSSNTRTANPNRRFREVGSKCSTTQRNGIDLRTANLKKCPREIERSNRSSTAHSPVQRKGTECPSCLINRSREAEGLKKRAASRVSFDQFSCKAMNTRAKNKELNESEWEDIRLIKAALINFVNAREEFSKLKIGKLAWGKINEWAYSVFYPEFIKYLDEKLINRENTELVIKAIMDYHVSRHDGYGRRLKKDLKEKRIYAIIYNNKKTKKI